MGTTQRIGNGVKNEPNWGNLSSSVTSIAKAIEELSKLDADENKIDENSENKVNPKSKNDLKCSKLEKRKSFHITTSIDRLVKIGGGSKNISSGKSKKIGRAGLRSTAKLVSFFTSVNSLGIETALKEIGFDNLQGKTTKEIIDYLTEYCSETSIGMDEIASKSALCEVFKELTEQINDDIDNLEELMKSYVNTNQLGNILCVFFGKYIYEYLWERLSERLKQIRGEEVSKETFISINKEIQERVKLLNTNRPLSQINWIGDDGKNEIEKIFESILKIEGE